METITSANKKLLTIEEASKELRLSRGTIMNLIFSQKLKAYKVRKKYLISTDAIEAMLKNSEV